MTDNNEFDIHDITFCNNLKKLQIDVNKYISIVNNDIDDAENLTKSMLRVRKVFKVRKATWYEITFRALIDQRKSILT
jgi:hypothetical protein